MATAALPIPERVKGSAKPPAPAGPMPQPPREERQHFAGATPATPWEIPAEFDQSVGNGLRFPGSLRAPDSSDRSSYPRFRPSPSLRAHSALGSLLPIQRKLAVGSANDPLEAEADRVAAQVMRAGDASVSLASGAPALRRKCACEGSGQPCEECKKKKEEKLQRKCAGSDSGMAAPPIVHQVLQSPGQPLDPGVRSYMEPRFQADFSRVRVHTGDRASESARAVNALAYTVGTDLVFAAGQYQPHSPSGGILLAHELTHVLQQNAEPMLRRACGSKDIGNPAGCETAEPVFPTTGSTFRFNVNCDTWSGNARKDLEVFAKLLPSILNVQIDAFASVDGPEPYNVRLACARAHAAKAELIAAGIAPSRITRMIDHGPTPGNATDRRSVVLSAVTTSGSPQTNTPAPQQNQQPNQPQNHSQNQPQNQPQKQPQKQPQNQPQKQPQDQPQKQPQNQQTNQQNQGQGQNPPPAKQPAAPDPLLVFQLPITPLGAQLPIRGPGGIGSGLHYSTPGSAYYQVYQPNIAAGLVLNSRPNDSNQNVQLGGFVQIGENFPLPGTSRPLTQAGHPTIFTGTNAQAYLQPSVVFYNKDGTQLSVLLQPGVARTFASRVAGENGTTVNLAGGVQWTQDIVANRWQFFLTITGGAADTDLDSSAAGPSGWQGWQPFIGLGAGIQFVPPLINYKPKE